MADAMCDYSGCLSCVRAPGCHWCSGSCTSDTSCSGQCEVDDSVSYIYLALIAVATLIMILAWMGGRSLAACLHTRATLARLNRLPTHKWGECSGHDCITKSCAVCLCDFSLGQEVKRLPCSHEFCKGCINSWLTTGKDTCPLCVTTVFSPGIAQRQRVTVAAAAASASARHVDLEAASTAAELREQPPLSSAGVDIAAQATR
jgi:Ring finger domain